MMTVQEMLCYHEKKLSLCLKLFVPFQVAPDGPQFCQTECK